jgi:hypothetical protein
MQMSFVNEAPELFSLCLKLLHAAISLSAVPTVSSDHTSAWHKVADKDLLKC